MKILMSCIIAIFLIGGVAFAKTAHGVDIFKEHSNDLSKASFYIRFQFEKMTGIYWKKSTFVQRQAFLEDYYSNLDQLAKDKKNKEKELKEENKKRVAEKRDKEKAIRERVKAAKEIMKEEAKEKLEEDKAYKKEVQRRIKGIQNLRRQQQMRKHRDST